MRRQNRTSCLYKYMAATFSDMGKCHDYGDVFLKLYLWDFIFLIKKIQWDLK